MFFKKSLNSRVKADFEFLSPVILMGRGHSGTRVFAWICQFLGVNLGALETARSGDAQDLKFTKQIKKIAIKCFHYQSPEEAEEFELEWLRYEIWKYYRKLGSPQGLWGWKFPETYLLFPMLLKILPRARFIHMIRDGRDIAFKRHLTDDPNRKLGKKILSYLNALHQPHTVQAALSWAYQVESFDGLKTRIPSDQLLEIKFESLCINPSLEVQKICRFLNTPMTPECEDFISNKINPKKVAQYAEQDREEIDSVEKLIRPVLKRHNYIS